MLSPVYDTTSLVIYLSFNFFLPLFTKERASGMASSIGSFLCFWAFIDMFFSDSLCYIYSPLLYCGYLYYYFSSFIPTQCFLHVFFFLFPIMKIWFEKSPSSIFIISQYFFASLIISSIPYCLLVLIFSMSSQFLFLFALVFFW